MPRGSSSSSSSSSSSGKKRFVTHHFFSSWNQGAAGAGGYYSGFPSGLVQPTSTAYDTYDRQYKDYYNKPFPDDLKLKEDTGRDPTGVGMSVRPDKTDRAHDRDGLSSPGEQRQHPADDGDGDLRSAPSVHVRDDDALRAPHPDDLGSVSGRVSASSTAGDLPPTSDFIPPSRVSRSHASSSQGELPPLSDLSLASAGMSARESASGRYPSLYATLDDVTSSARVQAEAAARAKAKAEAFSSQLDEPLSSASARFDSHGSSRSEEEGTARSELGYDEDNLAGRRLSVEASRSDLPALVLDNGGACCKVGLAGEAVPRAVFPSVVGRVRQKGGLMQAMGADDTFVGDQAQMKRGILSLSYPIKRGAVESFDDMELIWRHAFYQEMHSLPEEHNVMLTECPLAPKKNRERMAEIMFEKFSVPALYVASWAPLSLYALGRTTGIGLEVGHGVCYTAPVVDGYTQKHAVRRLDLAGQDITSYLQVLLGQRGYSFHTSAELEIVQTMKEKLAYVAVDFERELKKNATKVYELPDGQRIHLGQERFKCAEILFNPSLIGVESFGVHEMVMESIKKCEIDVRAHLYANVLLGGGTTMLPGFGHRLLGEICRLAPKNTKVNLIAHPERRYAVWRGGSILAAHPQFQPLWITRSIFEESGGEVIHNNIYQ